MKGKQSKGMKTLLLILPLLAVVAISGCIGGGGGITLGNGVKILNWEPDFSSVESGDAVQLRLKAQNTGERDALSMQALLTGINPEEWKLQGGDNAKNFGNLKAPDKVQNVDGEQVQYAFKLTAPPLPRGVSQPYSANLRIYYGYHTLGVKQLTFVNENELRRLQDKGESLPSSDTTVTAGPLNVKINTGKFIKVRDSQSGLYSSYSNTFPITIDIENTGGGVVSAMPNAWGAYDKDLDYKVFVTLMFPNDLDVNCKNILSSSYTPYGFTYSDYSYGVYSYGGKEVTGVAELWKGQDTSITCDLKITGTPLTSQTENIIVRLFYIYYIDSKATITVTGTGF